MKNYLNDLSDSIIISFYFIHKIKPKEIANIMNIEIRKVNSVINNYKQMLKKINNVEGKLKEYSPDSFMIDDFNLFLSLLRILTKISFDLKENENAKIFFHQFQMTMAKLMGKEWIVKREDIDMEVSESYFDEFVFQNKKQIRKANLELKKRVTIQDFLI